MKTLLIKLKYSLLDIKNKHDLSLIKNRAYSSPLKLYKLKILFLP